MSGSGAGTWSPANGGPISVRVPVEDLSRVGEARRAADALARSCGMDDVSRGALGVVVTEAATNLARHAQNGTMYFRDLHAERLEGVEMLAVDSGPGMYDVSQFSADGFSTDASSPGEGLGAMRRMSQQFDIYSLPGSGTALVARVIARVAEPAAVPDALVDLGVVCRPMDGESVCGDGWAVVQRHNRALVLVVDGLGHGPNAAQAADVARDGFLAMVSSTPAMIESAPKEILLRLHEALRATRGAAVVVASLDATDAGATVTLAGAGNVAASVVAPAGARALPSMNGTAGLQLRGVREFTADLPRAGQLIFHTDGIMSRWRLDAFADVLSHDPAIIAALLARDFTRGRDDATVLALRLTASR